MLTHRSASAHVRSEGSLFASMIRLARCAYVSGDRDTEPGEVSGAVRAPSVGPTFLSFRKHRSHAYSAFLTYISNAQV